STGATTWEFDTATLPPAEYAFKVIGQHDDLPESDTWKVTVEAVVKPTIGEVKDSAGVLVGNPGTTTKTPLKLTGTVAAGEAVKIYNGSTPLGDGQSTGATTWEFDTATLPPAEYAFKVIGQHDDLPESDTWKVTVEAVVKPTIGEVKDSAGVLVGNPGTTTKTPLKLTGTVAAGEKVKIYNGATLLGDGKSTGATTWEFDTATLLPAEYLLKVIGQHDDLPESGTWKVTVQASNVIPQITKMAYTNGGGPIYDGDIITDGRVNVTVKITPGKQGRIASAVVSNGPFPVNGAGEATVSMTFGKGDHYIRVYEVPAGKDSPVFTLHVR
ncbi:hypothetical protein, partial [Pseudomonas sp. H3(2019)]|uniref:hypothetical protein n=1 Tax=Pseudomonas sp. H3(2019) TaxID=2598724 RepID=UPI0015B4AE27